MRHPSQPAFDRGGIRHSGLCPEGKEAFFASEPGAALTECTLKSGQNPPVELALPTGIKVVQIADWQAETYRRNALDRQAANPREDFKRLCNSLQVRGAIGPIDELVWRVA